MKKNTVALVVLPLAALLALGGCARSPRTAAVVDGHTITVAELNRWTDTISKDIQKPADQVRPLVLSSLIGHRLGDKLQAKAKVDVSKVDEIAKQKFSPEQMSGPAQEFYREEIKTLVVINGVKEDVAKQAISDMHARTTVNPAFGALAKGELRLDAAAGSLSRTVESFTGVPSGTGGHK